MGDAARQNADAFQLLSDKSLLLGALDLGDVFDHGKGVDGDALPIVDKGLSQVYPNDVAIFLHIPLSQVVERHFASEKPLGKLDIGLQVVRVRDVDKRHLEKFRVRITHHLAKRAVDLHEAMVLSREREAERPFFEHPAELLFTLAQCLIHAFPLGDITNGGRDQKSFIGLQGAKTDFDRKLRPILAQAVQLPA